MGKYVKIALVLLYLLQLCIVFREQLQHLYEYALEARHNHRSRELTRPEPERPEKSEGPERESPPSVIENVVRLGRPEAILVIGHNAAHAVLSVLHNDSAHEPHPPEEERKDRVRRFRRSHVREFLISNLYHAVRRLRPSLTTLSERPVPLLRTMTFPTQSA